MNETQPQSGYRIYWVTWGILLALTALMLAAEALSLSRMLLVAVLLAAMLVKAAMIGGQFMHLRFERPSLVWAVAGTVLFLSAFLFILIAFDGIRIARMVQP